MKGELLRFLKAWLAYAESGAKEHTYFTEHGLCTNLTNWLDDKHPIHGDWEIRIGVQKLFRELLPQTNEEASYPFGGMSVYYREIRENTIHLNKQRLNWVKEMIRVLTKTAKN